MGCQPATEKHQYQELNQDGNFSISISVLWEPSLSLQIITQVVQAEQHSLSLTFHSNQAILPVARDFKKHQKMWRLLEP